MPYRQYQDVFRDIGFVWDQSLCQSRESTEHDLELVRDQFVESEKFVHEKERIQIIEELLDVTYQLIQQKQTPPLENEEFENEGRLSISKRKRKSSDRTIINGYKVGDSYNFQQKGGGELCSCDSDKQYQKMDENTPLKLPSKRNHVEEAGLTWQDVIGQEDAKRALYECCILPSLLPSSLFVGVRQLCMTVLLYGPPGTGKTTLVRVVAHESNHYLIELYPSSCLSKWAGEAERKIRDVFREAKSRSPCIIFLDEFDALALRRESAEDTGARRLLSELLIQFSAIKPSDRVTVVAATNRIADLDPAIIRRFQKTIEVPLPSLEERELLIQKGLNEITNRLTDEEIHYLAESTQGWSGSLLSNLCREAVMLPVLEISQAILSSSQATPFDVSGSSSRAFTPVSSENGDSSMDNKKETQIELRPVVFNDFLDALTSLQNRASIESVRETNTGSFSVCC